MNTTFGQTLWTCRDWRNFSLV